MSWSLVLGGAACVYDDLKRAKALLGEPDIIIAVKDIWVEYPKVDHVATYHIERIPRELAKRRALGYEDPKCVWTYQFFRHPKISLPVKYIRTTGGSSGYLGALVGLEVSDKVVLAGVPMDPTMPHFHNRKYGKPWKDGIAYLKQWHDNKTKLLGRVKSMSGFTKDLLGEPTLEWLYEGKSTNTPTSAETSSI